MKCSYGTLHMLRNFVSKPLRIIILFFSSDEACMMTDLSFMGLEEEAAKQRCKQMQHFFSLEDAYRGATVIMRCKEDFHLTGDFQTLEALIDLVGRHLIFTAREGNV